MHNYLKNVLKDFWMPALFMVAWLYYLGHLGITANESQQIVLGIILGTSLGFIADILKKSIDGFKQENRVKETARTLLAQDALSIYTTMEMIKRATENAPAEIKESIKNSMPPKLELHYWKYLTSERDFILLASEEPFASWYKSMFSWEKLNEMLDEAFEEIKDPNFKDKFKPRAGIAHAAYHQTVKDEGHKKFALKFFSEDELKKALVRTE